MSWQPLNGTPCMLSMHSQHTLAEHRSVGLVTSCYGTHCFAVWWLVIGTVGAPPLFHSLLPSPPCVCCSILDLGQKDNSDFIPAFLANMVHQLSNPGSTAECTQYRECAVVVLEHVLIQLKHHPRIQELVIGYYHQQLFRTGTELSLDKMMLQSLGRIAVATAVSLSNTMHSGSLTSYPYGTLSQCVIHRVNLL